MFASALRRSLKAVYWKLPARLRLALTPVRYALVARLGAAARVTHAQPAPAGDALPGWLARAHASPRLAMLPCAFEFDDLVNQRPINLARFLAAAGHHVLFVAWQWHPDERHRRSFEEVFPGVVQVPLHEFLAWLPHMPSRGAAQSSLAFLTFPAPVLIEASTLLRARGFRIAYDVLDDWQAFAKVGQAPWYRGDSEEQAVAAADRVFVVSAPLRRKFESLRRDIRVVPNGYTPGLIGGQATRLIARKAPPANTIGYFGHLTDAWFDWELVLAVAARRPDWTFEIIGYGLPGAIAARCAKLPSVRLLGKVPPARLHEHASRWNAALIPFKASTLSAAVDPIKIYEYLHFGLRTVVTGIPHLEGLPGVELARRTSDFEPAIERALGASRAEPSEATIDQFLEDASWHARFGAMLASLDGAGSLAALYEN